MTRPLFRAEASAARAASSLGQVILIQPLAFRLLSLCVVMFTAGIVIFLCTASYTRRIPASGVLSPEQGVIKVQAPRGGVVLERRVREGQSVHAGDVLYVLSDEVMYAPGADGANGANGSNTAGATASILAKLKQRQDLIGDDAATSDALAERESAQERGRVASLQAEIGQLEGEIAIQRERLASKQSQYDRNAAAQAEGFLSPLGLQQKYDELLDQKARLHSMQRSRLTLAREQSAAQANLDSLGRKHALARSQFAQRALDVEQDRVTRESAGRTVITAPEDGIVAAALAEPGQRVGDQTLAAILPRDSALAVELFIPSSAIGFIGEGDPVSVRFAAFPHQTFGGMQGRVVAISSTTLAAGEQPGAPAQAPGAEARYRVRVSLPAQYLAAKGRHHALRSGMGVEVQFAQETRTLIQWVLAPLFQLKDKT
jgi:membrane fusion protein